MVIDLERVLADQKDLGALCSGRPVQGAEAYWSNSNYGFARVLKSYAGYPPDEPVWAVIPHGVYFRSDRIYSGEVTAPVPAVLSYPQYADRAYRRFTNKHVIPSASPFLYALAQFRAAFHSPHNVEGTIFFPKHSTAVVDVVTDWDRLAQEVRALPTKYQPVTICLHWQDFVRGRAKPFQRLGLPLVSAGHFSDQEFLYRLLHLLSLHRYAASNDVASNLLYAVAAETPYFLVGQTPTLAASPGQERVAAALMPVDEVHQRTGEIRELFLDPVDATTDAQREAVDYQLGAARFKSPDSLLMDLLFAKRLAGR
jgi:hypothetical protein